MLFPYTAEKRLNAKNAAGDASNNDLLSQM